MDDVGEEIVKVIIKLAAAQRLREKQRRKMRLFRESGKDISGIEASLVEYKRIIREVNLERKELAAKLLKKRSTASEHESSVKTV